MVWHPELRRELARPAASLAATLAVLWGVLTVSPALSEVVDERPRTVSIAAPDYWCPYACSATAPRWGFTVDIARAALESSGYSVRYRNLPYDRALFEVANGRIDATLPTYKGEAPAFVYPEHAVSLSEYCFYAPADSSWRYSGPDSLEKIRLVATSGYSYGEAIDAYISANLGKSVSLIRGENIPERLRKMVQVGRHDALLDDRLLFESSTSSAGLVNAGCLEERHAGYLALSPQNPERSNAIADAFDRGFEQIRDEGVLCEILKRHDLGPWFLPGLSQKDCPQYEQFTRQEQTDGTGR